MFHSNGAEQCDTVKVGRELTQLVNYWRSETGRSWREKTIYTLHFKQQVILRKLRLKIAVIQNPKKSHFLGLFMLKAMMNLYWALICLIVYIIFNRYHPFYVVVFSQHSVVISLLNTFIVRFLLYVISVDSYAFRSELLRLVEVFTWGCLFSIS